MIRYGTGNFDRISGLVNSWRYANFSAKSFGLEKSGKRSPPGYNDTWMQRVFLIIAGLFIAGVGGKQSDQIRCRSQPNQLPVRSNPIPEFSGYYGGFCYYPPVGRCIIPIFALGWHRQIV